MNKLNGAHTDRGVRYKLVIVTISGRSVMTHAPVGVDGKARVPWAWAMRELGWSAPKYRYKTLSIGI